MISMDKKYRTRSGSPVRLLCVDGPNVDYPVVGIAEGDSDVIYWPPDGRLFTTCIDLWDLVEIKEKQVRYVNFYADNCACAIHSTKESADQYASKGRIACIKVEFEEGDGI